MTARSRSSILANVSGAAPTIRVEVPSRALRTPPAMGASANSTPFGVSAAMIWASAVGVLVVVSITTVPGRSSSARPPAPSSRPMTSAGPGSDSRTIEQVAAMSSAVANVAPAATRSSAAAGLRSVTRRSCSPTRRLAIAEPMAPTPTNPTGSMRCTSPCLRGRGSNWPTLGLTVSRVGQDSAQLVKQGSHRSNPLQRTAPDRAPEARAAFTRSVVPPPPLPGRAAASDTRSAARHAVRGHGALSGHSFSSFCGLVRQARRPGPGRDRCTSSRSGAHPGSAVSRG